MFLGESRENEVRLRNWKESTVCLRAFPAPQAPGTDRNLGLLNLVPRALGIVFRVLEAGQTLFLIGLQYVDLGHDKYGAHPDPGQSGHQQPLLPVRST